MKPQMLRATLTLSLVLAACATSAPRFSQEVAASFARTPMRKLTTAEVELYYPEPYREAALEIAARMSDCLVQLRAKVKTQRPRDRALIYLTDANFNNAYVSGQSAGTPLHTVLPLYTSSEGFHLTNLGDAAMGDIGCHELFHEVHFEQVDDLWRVVNRVFGAVAPPQAFLERWFTEGVAQYYEGRLGHPVGRPHAPLYRAELASGLASRGGWIGPGDLSLDQRELIPSSGAYLAGMHFIEYLADTYGEDKLWELMDLQGHSILWPFGVALRFKAVYGLSLGALIDHWSEHSQLHPLPRIRPPDQTVLRPAVGYAARLASAPDGTLALVSANRDEVGMLRLLEPDGRVRAEMKLARFFPERDWTSASPQQMSGLSFTADSRWLYLMNDDRSALGDDRAQLWQVDARTAEVVKVWQDVGGLGGAIHPSGDRYLFVDFSPGRSELVELDLATGARTALTHFGPGTTCAAPAWSPDGTRVVFSRYTARGFDLVLREPDGGLRALTADGRFNYGAHWIDGERIVFMRDKDGRAQAHQLDLASDAISVITDAPFAAFDVAPLPDAQLAFLDREGWSWSLDRAPLSSREAVELEASAATAAPPISVPPAPVAIESDERYHPGEGLLVPLLRVPSIANFYTSCPSGGGACTVIHSYSLDLAGSDRLSFHNWALTGQLTLPTGDLTIAGSYVNQAFAPWSVRLAAGYNSSAYDAKATGPGTVRQLSAEAEISRTVFTTPVSLAVAGFSLWNTNGEQARYFGPSVAFDYFAGESTVYGGLKRALGVHGRAALYPEGPSSFTVLDVEAGVSTAAPLPGLLRHSLRINVDGRTIEGAPQGALQVGGVPFGHDLFSSGESSGAPGPPGRLPQVFVLSVPGYENFSVRANRAVVGLVRYRYPFIVDRGVASMLYLFPSLFVRQVDLEAFASAALIDSKAQTWLKAAGGSVALRVTVGGLLYLSLYYRFAARFDAGLEPLHLVGFSFE